MVSLHRLRGIFVDILFHVRVASKSHFVLFGASSEKATNESWLHHSSGSLFWCGLPDLNRHGLPHAPQTCASAYSAKAAYYIYRGEPYHSIIRIYIHFVNNIILFLTKNNNTSCLCSDPFVVFLFAKLPPSDRWPLQTFSLMFFTSAVLSRFSPCPAILWSFPFAMDQPPPLLPVVLLQQLVLSLFFSIHFWWNHSLSFLTSSLIISLSILSKFSELTWAPLLSCP